MAETVYIYSYRQICTPNVRAEGGARVSEVAETVYIYSNR